MKNVVPYLIFNGNCKQAMDFYKATLKGEMFSMTYGQAAGQATCPANAEDKIIHARLTKGDFALLASDTSAEPARIGDNVQLYMHCESREEVDHLYKELGVNGIQKIAPADQFWGAYFAMVVDQYNIHWMLGFETPKK